MTPFGEHLEVTAHGVHGCLKALLDVLKTLKAAADLGIIHRDVSIGNINILSTGMYLILKKSLNTLKKQRL
jgi:RIO-like serine/threonine protein kinase